MKAGPLFSPATGDMHEGSLDSFNGGVTGPESKSIREQKATEQCPVSPAPCLLIPVSSLLLCIFWSSSLGVANLQSQVSSLKSPCISHPSQIGFTYLSSHVLGSSRKS